MPESVISTLGVAIDKEVFCFQTVTLRNRLNMDIDVDLRILQLEQEIIMIVSANDNYHRTTVSKNIEHIAFQLKRQYGGNTARFSVIEYAEGHYQRRATTSKLMQPSNEEWWQWRFNWVGTTPLDGQRYLLSSSKIEAIKDIMLQQNNTVPTAMDSLAADQLIDKSRSGLVDSLMLTPK